MASHIALRFAIVLALSTATLLARADDATAPDIAQRRAACIVYLTNPGASSEDKLRACHQLQEMGLDARPAAWALARQAKYDQPHVRELAQKVLTDLVGAREIQRLRAQPAEEPFYFVNTWLCGAGQGWSRFPEVAASLRDVPFDMERDTISALLLVCEQTGLPPQKVVDATPDLAREDVVKALAERFPYLGATRRIWAFDLAARLGIDRPVASPLLVQACIDDELPALRERARRAADRLIATDTPDAEQVRAVVALLAQPRVPPPLAAAARERLRSLPPAGRTAAVDEALYELSIGHEAARSVLKLFDADDTALARLAASLPKESTIVRVAGVRFFEARLDAAERTQVVELLRSPDPDLHMLGGRCIAADANRLPPHELLRDAVAVGRVPAPDVLAILPLDGDKACQALAPMLVANPDKPLARSATLGTLKLTRLHGATIRAAVAPLLDDPDDAVRYAAAELLDRQDILNRARVPDLLKDLRSHSLTLRLTAAHQLDELGVEPKTFTTALLRAVERRDMPVREGLLLALERAHAARGNALDALKQLAATPDDRDPWTRAYTRAALREVASAR